MSSFNIDTGSQDSPYQPQPGDPAAGTHGVAETDDTIITDLEAIEAGVIDLAGRVAAKAWTATTAVKLHQFISGGGGSLAQATVAGTTGSTQPTWPTTTGATVTDGTVTWKVLVPANGALVPTSQTTVGAPTTGTWAAGATFIDSNGAIWACSAGGTPGTWFAAGSGVELGEAELSASPAAITTTLADVAGLTVTFNAPARAFILDLTVPYVSVSASTVQLSLQITDSSNSVIAQAFTGAGTSWSATTVPPLLIRCRLPKSGGTAPYAVTPGTSYTFKVRGQTTAGTATVTDFSDAARPILRAVTC